MTEILNAAGAASVDGAPALRCTGVTKRFGGTVALDGVDWEVATGTVHALVGENGAGKSTLLGVLAGRVSPDAGRVEIAGVPSALGQPRMARQHGIAAIYQELTMVPHLTALENVFLGRLETRGGLVSRRAMRSSFSQLSARLGHDIDPDERAGRLSVADQQLLEIMRAVQSEARVLLFDEPTTALGAEERTALFRLIRQLRSQGITIVFVSHNLDDVLDIADTVTVFRNGRLQTTAPASEWTKPTLVAAMLGDAARSRLAAALNDRPVRSTSGAPAAPKLSVRNLSVPGRLHGVDLEVAPGEILGVAGLVGSGRSTLLRALAGLEPQTRGDLMVGGRRIRMPRTSREALRAGLALVPEDRKTQGLILGMSAMENIALSHLGRGGRAGLVSRSRMRADSARVATDFGLNPGKLSHPVASLSGGNQQKALLARWAHREPVVLLTDEPTRGIDIGAKEDVYASLRAFTERGVSVILVSSEFEEILAIADRVVVLARGRAREIGVNNGQLTLGAVLNAAFGLEEDHDEPC